MWGEPKFSGANPDGHDRTIQFPRGLGSRLGTDNLVFLVRPMANEGLRRLDVLGIPFSHTALSDRPMSLPISKCRLAPSNWISESVRRRLMTTEKMSAIPTQIKYQSAPTPANIRSREMRTERLRAAPSIRPQLLMPARLPKRQPFADSRPPRNAGGPAASPP